MQKMLLHILSGYGYFIHDLYALHLWEASHTHIHEVQISSNGACAYILHAANIHNYKS